MVSVERGETPAVLLALSFKFLSEIQRKVSDPNTHKKGVIRDRGAKAIMCTISSLVSCSLSIHMPGAKVASRQTAFTDVPVSL